MEFDPKGSAQSIPDMIKNDTLIEVLDQDQLSECLKYITLSVDDSFYILNQVQSKYKVSDRFRALLHIFTDFGEGDKFDSMKFVEFIRTLGRCLHLDIIDSVANIIESTFSKIDELSSQIKQNLQKSTLKLQTEQILVIDPQTISTSHAQTRQISIPQTQTRQRSTTLALTQQTVPPLTQRQAAGQNIQELRNIQKTEENFYKIYEICKRIAAEDDKDAMSFAINENFVYVTEGIFGKNVFTHALSGNKNLVRLLIECGIDINSKDKRGYTALIWASICNNYEIVKLLLIYPRINVNARDSNNRTALYWASRNGYTQIVEMLKANGAIE